ncbi:PH domain-containing protein [Romboutsia sp. 1001713B170131_170501_G6]|uniref:PH domain-containing protein n=1 Tax=Romboutsia sp. 1001713B170131_170501_G6 TaxID=2787108 RepID=UPI0018A9E0CB|nr:PH domain-containing protein [Romboutsia sp. 1001713B170131_170501_G6]
MKNFILMPAFIMIIIMVYFTMKSAAKPSRNILFGVTLPTQALSDDAILKMIDDYKRITNIFTLVIILTGLPIAFINKELLSVLYLLAWSLVTAEWLVKQPYIHMNRKLKKLKKDNEWFIGEKRVVSMDTKISRLKDKMPIPNKYILIPFGISLIPLIISIVKYDEDLKYATFTAFILMIVLVLLYFVGFRSSNKLRLKVYSKNSDINYILNKEEKYLNSIFWFITSLTSSIIFLFTYLVIYEVINVSYYVITIIAILGAIIVIIAPIYTNNRIKNLEEELLKIDREVIYTDDDEYWIDGYKYYNENDHNSKVRPRFGFNVYTYNLATKKGKISYYSGFVICAVIFIPLFFNLLSMELTNHKITISNESISVDYPSYDYEFSVNDIEDIKLVDEVSFKLRTNGIGTDEYCRGNFKSREYGKCRVYIYNNSKPYIIVKLKNNYFIYNEKTKDETMDVYNKLIEKL